MQALHAEVARAVVEQIQLQLTPREEILLAASRPVDPEAYDAFQKGQYHQNIYERGGATEELLLRSVEYYKEAIRRDPSWAPAYAALARTYHFLGPGEDYYRLSKATSLKALELDEGLAEAHASLAYVLFQYDHEWERAEREYRRSFELNPNLTSWGYALLLQQIGRWEEAIVSFKRAEESDPDSLDVKTQLGLVYMCASQFDEAVEQLQKVIELNPEYLDAHLVLGYAHMGQSMYEEAVADMENARELCRETTCKGFIPLWPALGHAYAQAGRTTEALEILRELEAAEHPFFAGLYVALGQKDKALAQLEEAVERQIPHLRCSWWDSLRDEPRFQDLVQRMNLPR